MSLDHIKVIGGPANSKRERSERKVAYHCFTRKYTEKVQWKTHLIFVSFCVCLLQV